MSIGYAETSLIVEAQNEAPARPLVPRPKGARRGDRLGTSTADDPIYRPRQRNRIPLQ